MGYIASKKTAGKTFPAARACAILLMDVRLDFNRFPLANEQSGIAFFPASAMMIPVNKIMAALQIPPPGGPTERNHRSPNAYQVLYR